MPFSLEIAFNPIINLVIIIFFHVKPQETRKAHVSSTDFLCIKREQKRKCHFLNMCYSCLFVCLFVCLFLHISISGFVLCSSFSIAPLKSLYFCQGAILTTLLATSYSLSSATYSFKKMICHLFFVFFSQGAILTTIVARRFSANSGT